MKLKFFLAFFLLTLSSVLPQSVKFLWIVNPEMEKPDNEFIARLNEAENDSTDFIIISGKIFAGKNYFAELKKATDELDIPVKILPAPSDYESFYDYLAFAENADGKTFILQKGKCLFIGLNSANNYEPDAGLFASEDLFWLKDELEQLPDSLQAFLFTDFPPDKIANFSRLETILKNEFFETIFISEKPTGISTRYYFVYPENSKKKAIVRISNSGLEARFDDEFRFRQNFKKTVREISAAPKPSFEADKKKLKTEWKINLNSSVYASAAVYKNKFYLAQNDGLLSCFDGEGDLLWDYDLFGDVRTSPAVKDNFVVASTLQGDLALLNALSGDALQTIGFDAPITSPLLITDYDWRINTMSPKTSGSKAAVVFGNADGKVSCYDVETLEKIWETQISDKPLFNKFYVAKNQILFVYENSVIAISKKNGAVLWRKNFGEKLNPQITFGRSDMFVFSNDKIFSVDIKLGEKNWSVKKFRPRKTALSKNRKTLFVIDAKGNLILLNSYNGKFKKRFPLKLKGKRFFIERVSGNLIVADYEKVFRINKKGKYSTALKSLFPLNTVLPVSGNEILFGNINGEFILTKYIEKKR